MKASPPFAIMASIILVAVLIMLVSPPIGRARLGSSQHFQARNNIPIMTFTESTLATAAGQSQTSPVQTPSSPSSLSPRTAASFGSITTNMTLQQVIDRVGPYDRERGSGILYYQYDFSDGSAALLGVEWPFRPTNRIQAITFFPNSNQIPLEP